MTKTRIGKIALGILLIILICGTTGTAGAFYLGNEAITRTQEELANFILTHPESTAVVAYTFDEDGTPIEDDYAVFYNADQPLVVGSMMKVIVLAAYADAVVGGELDPHASVSVADWERYYLPMTDGNAHVEGLASLGLAADDLGFARDQTATVTLDDLARIMIHYSENAATDYLLAQLGTAKLTSVMSRAGLTRHTAIWSILGVSLAMFSHEKRAFDGDQLAPWIAAVSEGDTGYLEHLEILYLYDETWRASQIEFMASLNESLDADDAEAVWAYQVEATQLFPKGTAREYAQLMALIARGKLLSPEASAIMQDKLETVPSDWPLRLAFYDRFGGKDGASSGLLALASYAVPKRDTLSGQARVVVIITNEQPLEMWATQSSYEGHYLLQIDLAQASGVFNKFVDSD